MLGFREGATGTVGFNVGHLIVYLLTGFSVGRTDGPSASPTEVVTGFSVRVIALGLVVGIGDPPTPEPTAEPVADEAAVGLIVRVDDSGVGLRVGLITGIEVGE